MVIFNLIKLAFLLIAFVGYFTNAGRQTTSPQIQQVTNHRDKRNIYLNAKAPILIAAYITIPVSVAFPALKQSRSYRFDDDTGISYNGTEVPDSYDDPLYSTQLAKIDLYMDYIGVADDMCRQRFLCEVASSPTTYSPLYDVFKKQLSTDFDLKKTYSSRFFRYYYAMVEGKRSAGQQPADASATCRQLYGLCPYDVEHTINMNVLRIMQFISRKFRIQFADTSL